jgi:hypothetical protein
MKRAKKKPAWFGKHKGEQKKLLLIMMAVEADKGKISKVV